MFPKEPDKSTPGKTYVTLKIPLKKIVKNKAVQNELFQTVKRVNKLVIHLYMFLRLWTLHHFEKSNEIPLLTSVTVELALKVLSKRQASGPRPTGNTKKIMDDFEKFYQDHYQGLGYKNKISGSNLSSIIESLSVDIFTNIENNIKAHFLTYLHRYVNGSHPMDGTLTGDAKKEAKKQLKKELGIVKTDLLENDLKCDPKYHSWVEENRSRLLPELVSKNYYYQIKSHPQSFLKHMFYMTKNLENCQRKTFQPFPLRTNLYPKYVPFDTHSLIDLLVKGGKSELYRNLYDRRKDVWDGLFKLDHPVFKTKKIMFDYRILTDGLGASLQFIYKDQVAVQETKKKNRRLASERARARKKLATESDNTKTENMTQEDTNKISITGSKMPIKVVKSSSEETSNKKSKKVSQRRQEWPYLEDVNADKLKDITSEGFLVVDPGKNNLICISDENNQTCLHFSNSDKLSKTRQINFRRRLQNFRKQAGCLSVEKQLSEVSGKSCDFETFRKYVEVKNKVNGELEDIYARRIFRKFKWYSYVNRERYFTDLVNRLKATYGTKRPIFYGDYQPNQHMRGVIPCPGVGLKRRIARQFQVYNLDEFRRRRLWRTSKLSYLKEEVCGNLRVQNIEGKSFSVHSVLTYQTESKRYGCIGRDLNAVRNMCKLVHNWLKHGERVSNFQRSKKDTNPLERGEHWYHVIGRIASNNQELINLSSC